MPIDQEALELICKIKIDFGSLLSSRGTGTMQAGLVLLRDAYRVAYQRSAVASARILAAMHSRDHGAGDGLPQLLRVLGHAVRSCARFAAANSGLMLLLLVVLVSLYISCQDYKPQQIA
jgi:hypothetical protein